MSKQGHVYQGRVDNPEDLGELLERWFREDERAYRAVFRPDDRQLDWFNREQAAALVAEWHEGRVFSARREVRWRKDREKYTVWLLTEEGSLPKDLGGLRKVLPEAAGWQAIERIRENQGIYLWGEYKQHEKAWVEVRLPRRLHYPVDADSQAEAAFVRVGHVEYQAPNGAVQFVRLTEVG